MKNFNFEYNKKLKSRLSEAMEVKIELCAKFFGIVFSIVQSFLPLRPLFPNRTIFVRKPSGV